MQYVYYSSDWEEKFRKILLLLVENGIDLQLKDQHGNTALERARKKANEAIIQILEEQYAIQEKKALESLSMTPLAWHILSLWTSKVLRRPIEVNRVSQSPAVLHALSLWSSKPSSSSRDRSEGDSKTTEQVQKGFFKSWKALVTALMVFLMFYGLFAASELVF